MVSSAADVVIITATSASCAVKMVMVNSFHLAAPMRPIYERPY
jgi:hypothetical protein